MARDLGVHGGYVDRAFKATDEDLKTRKQFMRRDQRKKFYDTRDRSLRDERKANLGALRAVQASRPLKPPGGLR